MSLARGNSMFIFPAIFALEIPGFMLVLQIVAMQSSILKLLLISGFALALLWVFQMSIHTTVISDLNEVLIMYGLDAREMSLNMWVDLMLQLISYIFKMVCFMNNRCWGYFDIQWLAAPCINNMYDQ